MGVISRYISDLIKEDLKEKMVFIGGPRQVGKTTLALQQLSPSRKDNPAYLNWDIGAHRAKLREGELPGKYSLLVLDEVHKFKRWRGLIKGFYDQYYPEKNFLITGSAKLDYYRRGGDSLQGRYHYWRLHPFTLDEVDDLDQLLHLGGFPEPFLSGRKTSWRRWNRERLDRVVQEDLRDLEKVQEISLIELLVDALPPRVGSPLSLNSLAEDLEVSPRSIDRWLEMLERLYVCYRLSPYGAPKIRAVKKSRKLYLWDWASVTDKGPRFENFVAGHLLKFCHLKEDQEGYKMELRYMRDVDGREIDFVVLQEKKPLFAVECKTGDKALSPSISYFQKRTNIPLFFQVHLKEKDFGSARKGGRVLPMKTFLQQISSL